VRRGPCGKDRAKLGDKRGTVDNARGISGETPVGQQIGAPDQHAQ
jgi:hypothetical protein